MSVIQIISAMNREDNLVVKAVAREKNKIALVADRLVDCLRNGGRLFFIGAGTSGRLGVLEAAELPPTFGTEPRIAQCIMAGGRKAVFRSQEGAEDNEVRARHEVRKRVRKGDLVIGIAASGVTPFVGAALRESSIIGAETALVTCSAGFSDARTARTVITLRVGPEIVSGSTRLKSGTATKMALNMITTSAMVKLGKVFGNRMVDLQPKSRKLRERGVRLVQELAKVSRSGAIALLRKSGWSVKNAVVMSIKKVSLRESRQILQENNGHLSRSIK